MIAHEFYKKIAEEIGNNGGVVPQHLVEALAIRKQEKRVEKGEMIKRIAKEIAHNVMYGNNNSNQ